MTEQPRIRLWLLTAGVFAAVVALCGTTCGDFGLTWDEPVYRLSQIRAGAWFRETLRARSWSDVNALLDPTALLYYWNYGRFGYNFHPPLSGLIDLFTYETLGGVMKDTAARRMGAVLTFAGASALLFRFLARRYGVATGLFAAGALILTPRVFADGQIAATDAPGLLFWPATALAFWIGMNESGQRWARGATGVCLGLAFLVKPVAFLVLLPVLIWFLVARLRPNQIRAWNRADWLDGLVTLLPLLTMLGVAFFEIRRVAAALPSPRTTQLALAKVETPFPDWAFAVPALFWLIRRTLARVRRNSPLWGTERPALETLAASLSLAPLVIWLGNPAWWRMSWVRLAHYYALGMDRRDALPQMPVHYFGQSYLYSSPWESGWVWLVVTTPLTILAAEILGLVWGLSRGKRDRLPLFFLLNAATLPMTRLLPVPGHDGTRLMLPAFFFLAAFGGWGMSWLAALCQRLRPSSNATLRNALVGSAVLIPSAVSLAWIHPFEMSYYNPILGGPRQAWNRGMELSYWYDALTPDALEAINQELPTNAKLLLANGLSTPFEYMNTLQQLGQWRPDLAFTAIGALDYPEMLVLTADSKADAFSRLLFVLRPRWSLQPRQLDRARVLSLYGDRATAVALALQLMLDVTPGQTATAETGRGSTPPSWPRRHLPILARLLGENTADTTPLGVNLPLLSWAKSDPSGFLAAADRLGQPGAARANDLDSNAIRLLAILKRFDAARPYSAKVLEAAPWSIPVAARLVVTRPEQLQRVMLHRGYTDTGTLGGYVDDGTAAASDR